MADYEDPKTCAVDVFQLFHVEDYLIFFSDLKLIEGTAQVGSIGTEDEPAREIENNDSFQLALVNR
jgi:hypothetical protein